MALYLHFCIHFYYVVLGTISVCEEILYVTPRNKYKTLGLKSTDIKYFVIKFCSGFSCSNKSTENQEYEKLAYVILHYGGTHWLSLFRHCVTNQKVAASISDGVFKMFH